MGSSASKSDNAKNNEDKDVKLSHKGSGPYRPYSEFPVVQRMIQSRLDYQQSTYNIPNDANGIPAPFPTLTSRKEIYEEYDFTTIDSRAEKAPPKLARDVSKLISYLCDTAKDDIEKVRAIFAWISSRNRINTLPELQKENVKEDTPLDCLEQIMKYALTVAYNSLFEMLCKEAKIPCKMVTGYVRASARELGEAPPRMGTYFMVFAKDNWRFIHPNWGSCYVKALRTEDDWMLVEGVSGQKSGIASATSPNVLGFSREDFWFFPDPEMMAHFFLSDQAEDQLLARPITQTEFSIMARLYQSFFIGGYKSISPPQCKQDIDESVIIEIELPDDDNSEYNYGVFKLAIDPDWNYSHDFRKLVFMEHLGDRLRVKVDMPHIGLFKFEISSLGDTLCEYLFNNKTPNFSCMPHPKNELSVWGLNQRARRLGLETDTEGGLIEANEGKAKIYFKLTSMSTKVKFIYRLEGDKGGSEELRSYVTHAKQEEKSVIFIRTPQYGKHVLKILSKDEKRTEFQEISNFLVVSDRGVADTSPLPCEPEEEIGLLSDQDSPLLDPISHTEAIIEDVPEGYVEIAMKEHVDLDILPVLTFQGQNKSQYVYHYKTADMHVFVIHLPLAGWYNFLIQARQNGSEEHFQSAYKYLIGSTTIKSDCVPFPTILSAWRSDFVIIEPREGLLQQNKRKTFRFVILDAEVVSLIRESDEIKLTKRSEKTKNDNFVSGDIWRAELDTGLEPEDIILVVKRMGSNITEELLKYKVMTAEEEETLRKNQRQAELEADKRRERIQKRAEAEAAAAKKRKQEQDKKIQAAQDDFKKNKEKYIRKQLKLDEEAKKKANLTFQPKEFKRRLEANDQDKWKLLQTQIAEEMLLEKLREAIKSKVKNRLEKAIQEVTDANFDKNEELLRTAKKELEIAVLKNELREAMQDKDVEAIRSAIQRIYESNYNYSRLQQDVAEGLQLLKRLDKIKEMKTDHLEMRQSLFAEIRRYSKPPRLIHEVIQAALLLFEKDEEFTTNWKTCQQYLTPNGSNSLYRNILNFNSTSVHPEVAARSREILKQYTIEKVQEVSPGAATIYVWAVGVTESLVPEDSTVTPASARRQQELFGYPVKSPKKKYHLRSSV